jgi:uncharacterized membrane protein YobD (UPF0266 family)
LPNKPSYTEFGSGYPFNVYLLIIIPALLLVTGLLNHSEVVAATMNLPIGMLTFYIIFSRFGSKIEISDGNEFKVVYFFPWDEDIQIDLEDFEYLYYEKRQRRNYDVLRFTSSAGEIQPVVMKVNTRIFDMERMIVFIEKETHLKVIRSVTR